MLKGINKQIIEIKCTNNEYFDKIQLFVKGEKSQSPFSLLQNKASELCTALTYENGKRKSVNYLKFFLTTLAVCLTVLGASITAAMLMQKFGFV